MNRHISLDHANLNALPYTFIKQALKVDSSCNSTVVVLEHYSVQACKFLNYCIYCYSLRSKVRISGR